MYLTIDNKAKKVESSPKKIGRNCPPPNALWGGGVSEGGKKPNCFFETSIFQRVSRIILGPPKHVLHLVWSAYFISTAVRTALKVARACKICFTQ